MRYVTLHVSVWVEMKRGDNNAGVYASRSTWACELKWLLPPPATFSTKVTLHVSVWVEMRPPPKHPLQQLRHAPRERVSWNPLETTFTAVTPRHAPRERVSWNDSSTFLAGIFCVTLHVSVWVEISTLTPLLLQRFRHAPRERVSWNFVC